MQFDVVAPNSDNRIKTKGNVYIEYGQRGMTTNINSVYAYEGTTQVKIDNQKSAALYTHDDKVYEVLMEIVGSDSVLELKDLDRIDKVAQKYKNFVQVDKKLEEGRVVLSFSNGYSMSIDFETSKEEELRDKVSQYKAPSGPKKQYYRDNLIEKYKDKYDIKEEKRVNLKGEEYNVYIIKAKSDANLSELESDLGIRHEAVKNNNQNYGKYDYKGYFIGNKPMKDEAIKIPVSDLGYTKDERNTFIIILDALYKKFN